MQQVAKCDFLLRRNLVKTCVCVSVCLCVCLLQVLNAIPDQDTFYDVSDTLEEQGLEKVIGRHRSRKGVERDLVEQFNLYEAMLRHEDGVADNTAELSTRMDNIRCAINCILLLLLLNLNVMTTL